MHFVSKYVTLPPQIFFAAQIFACPPKILFRLRTWLEMIPEFLKE